MRKTVFVICVLNLLFGVGALLFNLGSLSSLGGIGGFSVVWSLVMALVLVLVSYSVWKDAEVLEGILDHTYRRSESPERAEMETRREKAMESIMQSVDIPHYEKAKMLVDSYRKEGFLRPELVLESNLKDRVSAGLTMKQAIEELCKERGLD